MSSYAARAFVHAAFIAAIAAASVVLSQALVGAAFCISVVAMRKFVSSLPSDFCIEVVTSVLYSASVLVGVEGRETEQMKHLHAASLPAPRCK
ncbi:hypothetical protein BH09MYX1_BH09MYX1_62590 [soil metagenome]